MSEKIVNRLEDRKLNTINKFGELFDFINSQKLGREYREAYSEAVGLAKNLIDTKTKSSWDRHLFEIDISNRYPYISKEFISALMLCIKNYNPPVNLPDEPLW